MAAFDIYLQHFYQRGWGEQTKTVWSTFLRAIGSSRADDMGTSFSRNLSRFWNRNERRLLLVGLDAAGKTTILYHLRLGKAIASIPTVGFNVETIRYDRYKLNIWVRSVDERAF